MTPAHPDKADSRIKEETDAGEDGPIKDTIESQDSYVKKEVFDLEGHGKEPSKSIKSDP